MELLKGYRKIIIPVFLALLFFISSIVFYFYTSVKKNVLVKPVSDEALVGGMVLPTVPPAERVFNVLLLGHGDPSHPGGDLADSLIVVHLDTQAKKAALVSIPRDTWVALPVAENKAEYHKINEAYSVGKKAGGESGGFDLIKRVVTKVTDLPIHYFVSVDFSGLNQAISLLGGIEVVVPKTFDDYFYPVKGRELETCGKTPEEVAELSATLSDFELEKQFKCRYERLHFDAGKTKMDGETVLKFVRSRHSDQSGGDFARAERQQAVLLAIKDKLISLDALNKAPLLFDKLVHTVKTDIDQEVVKAVAGLIINLDEYQISRLVLSTDNVFAFSKNSAGQFILVPKVGVDQWAQIHQYLKDQIEGSSNSS